MVEALTEALGPGNMLFIAIGVLGGIMVGALPGFTATMGTALLLPFTFALPPAQGLAMLGALYVAAMFADSVPACLVNTPGTPSAVATALDGFQMTLRGRGQEAIVASCFSAMIGTFVGGFTFLFVSGPLADIALRFGPPEFFWIGIFAVTIIGGIAGDSLLKGIAGGALGMLVGTIGISATGAISRYTFGIPELRGGVSIVAALIGIFALPQILEMVKERKTKDTIASFERRPGVARKTIAWIVRHPVNLLRSSVLGTFVGILPGAGSPVASLMAYNEARRWSRDRQSFGKGNIQGVIASEAAGNSAAGGALVPLVALGVPGSAPAAVILGALLLQGVQPGPTFVTSQPDIVYGFAWSIIIAGVVTWIAGSVLSGAIARMILIPVRLLAPIVLFLSIVGAFAIRSSYVDVYLMLGLGFIVYLLAQIGFHPGPIGLGVILGPIVEPALVQSMAMAQASSNVEIFFGRPMSAALVALTVISALWVVWSNSKDRANRKNDVSEKSEVAG
ncbi:MAG: C4-dicarboxylate ABC transporter permease [Acidimicrobiia bacterium]|nr:C4-dicarboxylate ABC transporter permease [Acidimicrobiia bacterium]